MQQAVEDHGQKLWQERRAFQLVGVEHLLRQTHGGRRAIAFRAWKSYVIHRKYERNCLLEREFKMKSATLTQHTNELHQEKMEYVQKIQEQKDAASALDQERKAFEQEKERQLRKYNKMMQEAAEIRESLQEQKESLGQDTQRLKIQRNDLEDEMLSIREERQWLSEEKKNLAEEDARLRSMRSEIFAEKNALLQDRALFDREQQRAEEAIALGEKNQILEQRLRQEEEELKTNTARLKQEYERRRGHLEDEFRQRNDRLIDHFDIGERGIALIHEWMNGSMLLRDEALMELRETCLGWAQQASTQHRHTLLMQEQLTHAGQVLEAQQEESTRVQVVLEESRRLLDERRQMLDHEHILIRQKHVNALIHQEQVGRSEVIVIEKQQRLDHLTDTIHLMKRHVLSASTEQLMKESEIKLRESDLANSKRHIAEEEIRLRGIQDVLDRERKAMKKLSNYRVSQTRGMSDPVIQHNTALLDEKLSIAVNNLDKFVNERDRLKKRLKDRSAKESSIRASLILRSTLLRFFHKWQCHVHHEKNSRQHWGRQVEWQRRIEEAECKLRSTELQQLKVTQEHQMLLSIVIECTNDLISKFPQDRTRPNLQRDSFLVVNHETPVNVIANVFRTRIAHRFESASRLVSKCYTMRTACRQTKASIAELQHIAADAFSFADAATATISQAVKKVSHELSCSHQRETVLHAQVLELLKSKREFNQDARFAAVSMKRQLLAPTVSTSESGSRRTEPLEDVLRTMQERAAFECVLREASALLLALAEVGRYLDGALMTRGIESSTGEGSPHKSNCPLLRKTLEEIASMLRSADVPQLSAAAQSLEQRFKALLPAQAIAEI